MIRLVKLTEQGVNRNFHLISDVLELFWFDQFQQELEDVQIEANHAKILVKVLVCCDHLSLLARVLRLRNKHAHQLNEHELDLRVELCVVNARTLLENIEHARERLLVVDQRFYVLIGVMVFFRLHVNHQEAQSVEQNLVVSRLKKAADEWIALFEP